MWLDSVFHKGDSVVIVGDFNVWVDNQKDPDTKKLLTLMNAYGLTQIVKQPTQREGHTLDHVYTNEAQMTLKCSVDEGLDMSDHYPVMVEFPAVQTTVQENITFRNFKNTSVDIFKAEAKTAFEDILSESSNFETNYNKYKSISQQLLNRLYPEVTKTMTIGNDVKWMDKEFKECRARRRKLEKQWRKQRTAESHDAYKAQRK